MNRCGPPRTGAAPSVSLPRSARRRPGIAAPGPCRGVVRIPGRLQPGLDVAGVGGGRGRILGEPLAGVAPATPPAATPTRSQAAGGIEPERGTEQHDRFRRQVDHPVTADRGRDTVDEQRRAAVAKSVVRASMRTLSSQKPWTVAGRRAGASPEHVRPRTVSINARASFVPVCTRSSGGVFVGQLARPGRRRGRARRPRATPRSASADHRALNVRYWARLRWHVAAVVFNQHRAGQTHLVHVDVLPPRHRIQHRLGTPGIRRRPALRCPRRPPLPASSSVASSLPGCPHDFRAASPLPKRSHARRERQGAIGRLLGPPRTWDPFLLGLGSGRLPDTLRGAHRMAPTVNEPREVNGMTSLVIPRHFLASRTGTLVWVGKPSERGIILRVAPAGCIGWRQR